MKEYEHLTHTFEPVFNRESKILILGSFPSVKSRENNFYYGHPQNRFWKVLAQIFEVEVPQTIDEIFIGTSYCGLGCDRKLYDYWFQ